MRREIKGSLNVTVFFAVLWCRMPRRRLLSGATKHLQIVRVFDHRTTYSTLFPAVVTGKI